MTSADWMTGKTVSSCWLYFNRMHPSGDGPDVNLAPVPCPVAVGIGPHEIYWPPRATASKVCASGSLRITVPTGRGAPAAS